MVLTVIRQDSGLTLKFVRPSGRRNKNNKRTKCTKKKVQSGDDNEILTDKKKNVITIVKSYDEPKKENKVNQVQK